MKLKNFVKFDSAASALEEVSAIVESKVSPMLQSLLEGVKDEKKATLIVSEPKLGMGRRNSRFFWRQPSGANWLTLGEIPF